MGELPMMRTLFDLVAAAIFAAVSFIHMLRIILGWEVRIGMNEIPFSMSWAGMFLAAALSVWGFAMMGKSLKRPDQSV
jgi:hypothetical protein